MTIQSKHCNLIGCVIVDPHYHTAKGTEFSRMELIEVINERDLWKMRSDDAEKEIVRLQSNLKIQDGQIASLLIEKDRLVALLATERDEFGKKEAELKAELENKVDGLTMGLESWKSRCARLEEALKKISQLPNNVVGPAHNWAKQALAAETK